MHLSRLGARRGADGAHFRTSGVQTVYHAAAYKHVPLVEHNAARACGTTCSAPWVARAAHSARVETFVLVSTDKAVRPTNVMGASKRMAELILQALHCAAAAARVFSMVRFGNVLGSRARWCRCSASRSSGGPVTVTHPDVTRYFMTIPEAAQLVIQAGAMAHGGEVFVLDMGEPVRIIDLAVDDRAVGPQREDRATRRRHRDQFVGLRPGEKLYEELLIGDDVVPTAHSASCRRASATSSPRCSTRCSSRCERHAKQMTPTRCRARSETWCRSIGPPRK